MDLRKGLDMNSEQKFKDRLSYFSWWNRWNIYLLELPLHCHHTSLENQDPYFYVQHMDYNMPVKGYNLFTNACCFLFQSHCIRLTSLFVYGWQNQNYIQEEENWHKAIIGQQNFLVVNMLSKYPEFKFKKVDMSTEARDNNLWMACWHWNPCISNLDNYIHQFQLFLEFFFSFCNMTRKPLYHSEHESKVKRRKSWKE